MVFSETGSGKLGKISIFLKKIDRTLSFIIVIVQIIGTQKINIFTFSTENRGGSVFLIYMDATPLNFYSFVMLEKVS